MISSAFKGAVQSEVQSQGQTVGTAFQPAKEFAGATLGMIGLKGIGAAAISSIGEAATQALTQEKMLSAVQSQQSLDMAFERSIQGEKMENIQALSTVYEKLMGAKREEDAKRKLMDELMRGEEE